MSKYILLIIAFELLSISLYSQNDFFPLKVGNEWNYSYNSVEKLYYDISFMYQKTTESGYISYSIIDSSNQDSIIVWNIIEKDSIERLVQKYYIDTLFNDTTYTINDINTFQLKEYSDSVHILKSESYYEVFTFPVKWERFGNISSTTAITRFSQNSSVLTIKENKFIIASYFDSLVFHKDVGLVYAQSIINKGPNTPYYYKWEASLSSFLTDLIDEINKSPNNFLLSQNYPNPFNPNTNINYSISQTSFVTLKVYDLLGKEVAILVNEVKPIGNYETEFDGSNLSSGVYFYRMQAGSFSDTKKFILLR